MADTLKPHVMTARRMLGLTTAATTAVVGFSAAAGPAAGSPHNMAPQGSGAACVVLAQAAGEGANAIVMGECAASGDGREDGTSIPDQAMQRYLSFMEEYMRAGLELYKAAWTSAKEASASVAVATASIC